MSTFQMPFYLIKTVSHSEKDEWIRQAQAKAKKYDYKGNDISQFFEPVKGWRPFAEYGTDPLQIIHNCIKDYDNTVNKILFCKDFFTARYSTITLGTPKWFHLSGRIAAFDFYRHEYLNPRNALIVPGGITDENTSAYNIKNIKVDYLQTMLSNSYDDYYNKLPLDAQKYILETVLPYIDSNGKVGGILAHVFPPAICELQGNLSGHYSMEVASKFTVIDMPKVYVPRQLYSSYFWTRESFNGQGVSKYAVRINQLTGDLKRCKISNFLPLFPCFCIG